MSDTKPPELSRPPNLQAIRDLAREAKERAEAATPGPWAYGDTAMWSNDPDVPDSETEFDFGDATVIDCCPECDMEGNIPLKANRDFIAAARSDVPKLADAILALTAEVEQLQADRDNWRYFAGSIVDKWAELNTSASDIANRLGAIVQSAGMFDFPVGDGDEDLDGLLDPSTPTSSTS